MYTTDPVAVRPPNTETHPRKQLPNMPTLAEALRNKKQQQQNPAVRGPDGVLTSETPEEIQTLAEKAGLPAPPTTPLGAAAIGGTPKQQDMAGSPAQKQAALSIAQQPSQDLATVQRQQQVRSQANQQEQGEIQKSENLKSLGGLGDRVNDFINVQRKKLEQSQAQLQAADSAKTNQGSSADMASLKPLLQQLSADPNNMSLQLQVNQALGYDGNKQLSPDEIQNLYKSSIDSISASGADAVDNQLTANDLIAQGNLGYDANQLSSLLGVPVDQVGSMSVGDIRNQINQLTASEFSNTKKLEQQAGSINAGQAERALARQGAREASATGLRSSESDVQHLNQQIANADQVQFGGNTYKVDDLLKDSTISGIVTDYLNAAPGSPTRTQLEKSEPSLIQFIQKNQAVLHDAADHLSQGANQFQQLQQSNKQAASLGGLLDESMVSQLVPGYNQLSDKEIDPSSVPVLAAAQNLNPGQKANYAATLKNLASKFPGITNELAGLSQEEVQNLGFDNPNGKWKQFEEQEQRYQDIVNTPDEDLHALIGKIYNVGDNEDLGKAVEHENAYSALGIFSPNQSLSLIDSDHDGKIDSPAAIKARLVSGQPSLKSALSGQKSVLDTQKFGITPDVPESADVSDLAAGKPEAIQSSLVSRFGDRANDGIDGKDISSVYSNLKPKGLEQAVANVSEMSYLLSHGKLDSNTKATLSSLINNAKQQATDQFLSSSHGGSDFSKKFGNITIEDAGNNGKQYIQSIDDMVDDLNNLSKSNSYGVTPGIANRINELNSLKAKVQEKTDNWNDVMTYGSTGQKAAIHESTKPLPVTTKTKKKK